MIFRATLIILFFISTISLAQPVLTPGNVIDTVRCLKNPAQSYALYLPRDYTPESKLPVIFFYEPGGRGKLVVTRYQSLAEKYHFILISSNNSRNGPFKLAQDAEQAMVPDVVSRFSVDKSKFFVSGLSGGARTSVFLALRNRIYAGIITCGAAFPPDEKLISGDQIPFVELIGIEDFNLTEAITTKKYLEGIKYPHSMMMFQGDHEWPPLEVFDQAIFWQMTRNQMSLTDLLKKSNEEAIRSKLTHELDSGDVYMAYLNAAEVKIFASKTFNVDSILQRIAKHALMEKQQKEFVKTLVKEEDLLQQFFSQLAELRRANSDTVYNEAEWRRFTSTVKKISKSDSRLEARMGYRVLQTMRVASYEGYKNHWAIQDYLHATLTVRLLTLIDNDNWSYVQLAKTYAARLMKKETLQALSKAVSLGLRDKKPIEDGKEFQFLANEKKFKELMRQIDLNSK